MTATFNNWLAEESYQGALYPNHSKSTDGRVAFAGRARCLRSTCFCVMLLVLGQKNVHRPSESTQVDLRLMLFRFQKPQNILGLSLLHTWLVLRHWPGWSKDNWTQPCLTICIRGFGGTLGPPETSANFTKFCDRLILGTS